MNATPCLPGRHPRTLRRWRVLAVIGAQVHDFVDWLGWRGYADNSVSQYLRVLPSVVRWWRRKGVRSFEQLTMQILAIYLQPKASNLKASSRARDFVVAVNLAQGNDLL